MLSASVGGAMPVLTPPPAAAFGEYGSGLGYFQRLEAERAVSEEPVPLSRRSERRASSPPAGASANATRGIPLSLGDDEVDRRFPGLLQQLGIPKAKQDAMLKMPLDKKREMLAMYAQHQAQDAAQNEKLNPAASVEMLRDDAPYDGLKTLSVHLKSCGMEWVRAFLQAGAVDAFAACVGALCRFEERSEDDAYKIEAALAFYRDVLGFRRTDYMNFGPDGMGIHFLRCTARHHSIALLQVGPPQGLQHVMFEATSLDGVGRAHDRALAAGVPISSNLGRHRNDKTVSFSMQGPSGFDVEIGCDGLLVGEDWVEHEFAGGGDDWGHHGLDAESLQPKD